MVNCGSMCQQRRQQIEHAKQMFTFSANDVKPDWRRLLPLPLCLSPASSLLFGLKQVDKQRHGHLEAKVKTGKGKHWHRPQTLQRSLVKLEAARSCVFFVLIFGFFGFSTQCKQWQWLPGGSRSCADRRQAAAAAATSLFTFETKNHKQIRVHACTYLSLLAHTCSCTWKSLLDSLRFVWSAHCDSKVRCGSGCGCFQALCTSWGISPKWRWC